MRTPLRWGRIIAAAVLLEIALTAVVLPVGLLFGDPLHPQADGRPADATVYFAVAAVACLVLGFVFGMWAARKATSAFALHGLLVGIAAIILYLGLGSAAPGGVPGVIAAYGAARYLMFNLLRTAGCVAGAMYQGRKFARA